MSDSGSVRLQDAGPSIELRGARKSYRLHGEVVEALQGLDLEVGASEFFSLLGPSGCGKTTTMRLIAGFEILDSGTLRLAGRDVSAVPPNRRDINMVFQNYALFPHLNVWDNISFGLRRQRVPAAEIRRRVDEMVDSVGLRGKERRRPNQLSGGQQQRVALARALVNRPAALLLDEPLGALDLQLRQEMQVELKRVQREVGIAFVYVTHDQNEALAMSDRIAVMRGGRIEQLGTPEDIYERPASSFVAKFIGASNVLSGRIRAADGGGLAVDIGGSSPVLVSGQLLPIGTAVELSARPERLELLAETAPSTHACTLDATVIESIYQGTMTQLTVDTPRQGIIRLSVASRASGGSAPRRGQEIRIAVNANAVHVIGPAESEHNGLESEHVSS